jgi:hypothetical protein
MVLCDYFAATDDSTAVGVLDVGGPSAAGLDMISLKGLDPVVVMVELEAILTGCTYEEASQRPRAGRVLSSSDSESAMVVSVSDSLQEALVSAAREQLVDAAAPWSKTEEMQQADITRDHALDVLVLLSELAQRARSAGLRLYCWWAL